MLVYISTKYHENILHGIKVIERTRFLSKNFQRAIIPLTKVDGVSVFIFCTLSDDGLYLYKVS